MPIIFINFKEQNHNSLIFKILFFMRKTFIFGIF